MEEKILELLAEIDEGILSYDGDDLFVAFWIFFCQYELSK